MSFNSTTGLLTVTVTVRMLSTEQLTPLATVVAVAVTSYVCVTEGLAITSLLLVTFNPVAGLQL